MQINSYHRHRKLLGILTLLLILTACEQRDEQKNQPISEQLPISQSKTSTLTFSKVDGKRVENADQEPHNWLAHGRTYSEQRFSPLTQINTKTIDKLGLTWLYNTKTVRGMEATPIVVDGVMYISGSWSKVYALNAKTGEELWTYDPAVPGEWARYACCDVVNRGVAVWQGRVYVASLDGRLIALDGATGLVEWEIDTINKEVPYTITGAPRVINGNVIIGNGGAEYGVRGYITAYDSETGKQKWRFYTVPGDPQKPVEHPELSAAMKTWSTGGTENHWWELGGGGTAWDSMAFDPKLNLLYVGTGNGSPWTRWVRSPGGGDNLYLSSILAINPDTGRLAWHYQTTPGDNWDYTATQHMILASLEIEGKMREVIMQAPKNGFFYVLDRATGELLSADAYADVTWATGVDLKTGRPIENPKFDYKDQPQAVLPGPGGAHNWYPMAYSPLTGLVYIPVHDLEFLYTREAPFEFKKGAWNTGNDFSKLANIVEELGVDITKTTGNGILKAWDPVARKVVWTKKHLTVTNGGVLATAGNLVFQGSGDGQLFALKADDGEVLWSKTINTGIIAPPITYQVGGEQYVAVLAGWGGGGAAGLFDPNLAHHDYGNDGRLLVFKLGGESDVPLPEKRHPEIPQPPALEGNAQQIAAGKKTYHRNCAVCHGLLAVGSYSIKDLRYSDKSIHDIYPNIVLDGIFAAKGMASFADLLEREDVDNIQAYVLSEAWKHYNKQESIKSSAP
jgi:quinohemoprotein ethanol dehydrogenase